MQGILFSQMTPPASHETEFDDWYEEEHIPVRLALPGIDRARRYYADSGERDHLAVYEISDFAVFQSPGFRALKDEPSDRTRWMLENVSGFTRYWATLSSDAGARGIGDYLSVNAFDVPDDRVAAFDDWYESEHVPRLLEAADWLRVRRFVITDGDGPRWTHLALHELASAGVMDSPERRHARTGPKRDAFVNLPWFTASGRWLYRLVSDAKARDAK